MKTSLLVLLLTLPLRSQTFEIIEKNAICKYDLTIILDNGIVEYKSVNINAFIKYKTITEKGHIQYGVDFTKGLIKMGHDNIYNHKFREDVHDEYCDVIG